VIGWLLDTNVISTIINPNGAATVKAWAATQNQSRCFLSMLALAEYDKGIHDLPDDHPNRPRFIAARDRLVARFAGRIVSVGDAVVRRWGVISGDHKRLTGVADVRASGAQIFDPWMDDPANFPLSPMSRSRH
jgi:toxin FitB